jgi:hypothetical protein
MNSNDKKSDEYKNHKILVESSLKSFLNLNPDEKKKTDDKIEEQKTAQK